MPKCRLIDEKELEVKEIVFSANGQNIIPFYGIISNLKYNCMNLNILNL